MKITDVETIALGYAIDDVPPRRRSFAIVKVTVDEGLIGWGEASDCYGHSNPLTIKAMIDETLRWLLIDQDPLRGSALISDIRRRVYPTLGHRGLAMQAISAIDIALWDLRGKAAGASISAMLGAQRMEIDLYAAGKPEFRLTGAEYCEEVLSALLAQGVGAVKVRPGRDIEWDTEFLHSVRDALPANTLLLVDGKYNYRWETALRLGRVLEEIDALCFEEPLPGIDLERVARLAAALNVPLAYGEQCFTIHDFRDLMVMRAAGIAEPDATICGGITEMTKIGALCESFGVDVMPHCGGLTAIGLAANLHAASVLPTCRLFEFDARAEQPLRDELVRGRPFGPEQIVEGRLPVPTGPGLGVEVVEDALARFPYSVDESIARSFPVYSTPHV